MLAVQRAELVERVAEADDELAEVFLAEEEIDAALLRAAVRRATVSLRFVPVFMGSAYKNKGVQLLLDGVSDYLPSPLDVTNTALDATAGVPLRLLVALERMLCYSWNKPRFSAPVLSRSQLCAQVSAAIDVCQLACFLDSTLAISCSLCFLRPRLFCAYRA